MWAGGACRYGRAVPLGDVEVPLSETMSNIKYLYSQPYGTLLYI